MSLNAFKLLQKLLSPQEKIKQNQAKIEEKIIKSFLADQIDWRKLDTRTKIPSSDGLNCIYLSSHDDPDHWVLTDGSNFKLTSHADDDRTTWELTVDRRFYKNNLIITYNHKINPPQVMIGVWMTVEEMKRRQMYVDGVKEDSYVCRQVKLAEIVPVLQILVQGESVRLPHVRPSQHVTGAIE